MRKFKLIKEYPGSPKLNTVISSEFSNCGGLGCKELPGFIVGIKYLDKYPEFWQEIIEKDYEILSYIENHLEHRFGIKSIKRLSDGEIFTVGDKVINDLKEVFTIKTFFISSNNNIWINHSYAGESCYLHSLEHIKKPLFTTEDDVDIYEGDNWWCAYDENYNSSFGHNWKVFTSTSGGTLDLTNKSIHRFSSKEAAEEYILMNKPCLSLKDIFEIVLLETYQAKLKYIIKDKLNL